MRDVVRLIAPLKVLHTSVPRVRINVIHLRQASGVGDEGFGYQPMHHATGAGPARIRENDPWILRTPGM